MRVYPRQAFFRPGEPIQLTVRFDQPVQAPVEVTVFHLAEPIALWKTRARGTTALIAGQVPAESQHGYLAHVQAGSNSTITAFDVLEDWTQAPRYGFLYDFRSGHSRESIDSAINHLLALHINGLQFYDWQYRHDMLVPPQVEFIDPLGRSLSLATIHRIIVAAKIPYANRN